MTLTLRNALTRGMDKAHRAITRLYALIVAMQHGDSQNEDRRQIARACLSICQASPHLRARQSGFANALILIAATVLLIAKGKTRYNMPMHVAVIGAACVAATLTQKHVTAPRHKARKRAA